MYTYIYIYGSLPKSSCKLYMRSNVCARGVCARGVFPAEYDVAFFLNHWKANHKSYYC